MIIFFASDALVNRKPKVEIAYQNQDTKNAKKSVERILKENLKLIL